MPELPEVEVERRALTHWLKGRKIVGAETEASRVFRGSERKEFEQLRGKVSRIDRKGKYLLWTFENGKGAVTHLGMTGKWLKRKKGDEVPHSRARFVLDDGTIIHYRDPRLFGRIEPVPAEKLWDVKAVAALGLDALNDSLDWKKLKDAVAASKQDLKVALMDQGRIAGLGNIHAAEALYRARIHPARKPQSLSDDEWKALAKGIHATIQFALDHESGDEIQYVEEPGAPNPFLIYGRAGEKCKRCGGTVQLSTQGGRSTHFCPKCQPLRPTKKKRSTK